MARKQHRISPHVTHFIAAVCLTSVGTLALIAAGGWRWIWAYLASVNIVTILFYAVDKSAARAGPGRIPERQLHILAIAGGTLGALLARHALRHKTIKGPFRVVFWLIFLIQAAGLGAWLWWQGRS